MKTTADKPKNLYEILQVQPRAEQEVVQAAYYALVKIHHPDPNDTTGNLIRRLNEAKETLLDPGKRKKYDEERFGIKKGKVVGNYRILEKIAEGGFGNTYRAENIIVGEEVCIKHGHRLSSLDEEILRNEAKSIWNLRHSGIPAMRDMLQLEDGSLALVMSYIPGPTLAKIIEKHKRLDPEHVAWISERTLSALWYLHMNGVVHGDVKPQNIIIQPEQHAITLVDYGLSAVKPSSDMKPIGYTEIFAPPEQIKGRPLLPESDFYSLGMTMICALGGDLAKKRVPSSTPDALAEFIGDLVVPEVKNRPTWDKINLVERLVEVRQKSFGRKNSGMAPLPGV
ncbi:MAG: protein kinase [Nanoarchaeota archaeon]|nr:protein kinase [Nanoarchaeota archaeon]